MRYRNRYLNADLFVSPHAADRFTERCSGNIEETVLEAVPFGAAWVGNKKTMFIHGDNVLGVSKQNGGYTVLTFLTKEMAIGSMQAKGLRAQTEHKQIEPVEAPKPKTKRELDDEVDQKIRALLSPNRDVDSWPLHYATYALEVLRDIKYESKGCNGSIKSWINKLLGKISGRIQRLEKWEEVK